MSNKKKPTQQINQQNIRKFNPDTDTVPYYISGVGVASNNQDTELLILDFFADNFRANSNTQIILGSYAMSKKMAGDIIEMITKALEETKNKEDENNDSK